MENTSKPNNQLSRRDTAYYRRRNQNRIFADVASFFAEEAAQGRITRKEMADKLGKNPSQITRWLSGPSNFELDTLSDILLAMDAEMDCRIVKFADRAKPNMTHHLVIKCNTQASRAQHGVSSSTQATTGTTLVSQTTLTFQK